jgi:hypothetical protein
VNVETATNVQTFAAIIQGVAAIVFLGSVAWDARERRHERQRREQTSRDNIVAALARLWRQRYVASFTIAMTDEELAGFYSERQIIFFNQQLEEMGLAWRYPFKPGCNIYVRSHRAVERVMALGKWLCRRALRYQPKPPPTSAADFP